MAKDKDTLPDGVFPTEEEQVTVIEEIIPEEETPRPVVAEVVVEPVRPPLEVEPDVDLREITGKNPDDGITKDPEDIVAVIL